MSLILVKWLAGIVRDSQKMLGLKIGILCLILLLGGFTFQRNKVWADRLTLWEDAVSKASVPRAHHNLGIIYSKRGHLQDAVEQFGTAIKLDPKFVLAMSDLGVVYAQQGHIEAAIAQFERVLEIDPDNEYARRSIKLVRARQNKKNNKH